jgi:RNase H-fold protein (predicted Holliday junction resolvase)
MSAEARGIARKFALSLNIPVYLQDERVTSHEAKFHLWERSVGLLDACTLVDIEAGDGFHCFATTAPIS